MNADTGSPHVFPHKLRYFGLLLMLVVVVVTGYGIFRLFATTPDLIRFNLYLLAVVAGVGSFFSPCAFPLLPGYFAFYHAAAPAEHSTGPGKRRGWLLGAAAASGVISFSLVLGLLMALLGTSLGQALSISGPEPSALVRIVRGSLGGILFLLGVGQLSGWNLKPAFVDAFAYHTRPKRASQYRAVVSLYLYGLGYNAAGMGCTGPILAGLLLTALTSGSFAAALTAFVIFALTMGSLMLLVSGLVAASQETLVSRLKAATPRIKQGAGILLILVGLLNLLFALNVSLFLRLLFP